MRWLIGIVAVFVTLWCGWWFAGRYAILTGAEQIIADQRAAGAELDLSGLSLAGFPSRFDLSVDSITWRDPSGRNGYEGGAAYAYAMSWKPWHLVFWLPDSQVLTLNGQPVQIDGQKLHASLRAGVSTDLPLALATFSGEALTITAPPGLTLGLTVEALRIEAEPPAATAAGTEMPSGQSYRLGARLTEIRPDPALELALAQVNVPQMPENPLPGMIDGIHLDATTVLSAPLDRRAGQTKPQIVSLDLRDLSLIWGDLQMTATGALSPDDNGFAAGTISLSVRGWEQLPRLFVATGLAEPQMAGVLSSMLRGLASQNADPSVLVVPLTLRDGWASFGPLPLGPAPKLGMLPGPRG